MRQITCSRTSPTRPRWTRFDAFQAFKVRNWRRQVGFTILSVGCWCWPVPLHAPALPVAPASLAMEATTAFLLHTTSDVPLARRIARVVVAESQRAQLDLAMVLGVLLTENTTLRPRAVSSVGALGLFQVMPLHDGSFGCPAGALREVEANACHGIRLLRVLGRRAHNNWTKALLAYNGCVRGTNTPHCDRYPRLVARRAAVARTSLDAWAQAEVATRITRVNAATTASADIVRVPAPVRRSTTGWHPMSRPASRSASRAASRAASPVEFTRRGLPAIARLWGRPALRAFPARSLDRSLAQPIPLATVSGLDRSQFGEDTRSPRWTPRALNASRAVHGSAWPAILCSGLLVLGLRGRRPSAAGRADH